MLDVHNRIVGTGMYVPDKILTNDDLKKMVDTNDEWIYSRTGIKERRISTKDSTSVLGAKAVEHLLNKINRSPLDIDLIVFCTFSPEYNTPSCSCEVQRYIGAVNATAFDLNAACTGFVYGLIVVDSLLKTNKYKNAVLIGGEVLSNFVDWTDRNTCVLFGDGAGAVFIENSSFENSAILDSYTKSIGDEEKSLMLNNVSFPNFDVESKKEEKMDPYIRMDGREVFKFAVKAILESLDKLLSKNNLSIDDIKYIVPHQANIRIIQTVAQKLKINVDKFFINLDKYGNTSAASIPIALNEMNELNMLKNGDLIVIVGFGSGLTYGSVLLKW